METNAVEVRIVEICNIRLLKCSSSDDHDIKIVVNSLVIFLRSN